jgi:hypothetical protein
MTMNSTFRIMRLWAGLMMAGFLTAQSNPGIDTTTSGFSIKLSTEVDTNHVPLNRLFTLTVRIAWDAEQNRIDIVDIEEPILSNLEITGTSRAAQASGGSGNYKTVHEIIYTLKPVNLGMAYIESVWIQYQDNRTGESYNLKTERISVEVLPPVKEKNTFKLKAWHLVILGLILAGTGAVIYMLFFRRISEKKGITGPQLELEEDVLSRLKSSVSLKDGDRREAFSELSKLFRRYLADKFGFPALELTTDALLEQLKATGREENWMKKCEVLFKEADVIKFSGQEAPQSALESAYTTIETFLEKELQTTRKMREEESAQQSGKKGKKR